MRRTCVPYLAGLALLSLVACKPPVPFPSGGGGGPSPTPAPLPLPIPLPSPAGTNAPVSPLTDLPED